MKDWQEYEALLADILNAVPCPPPGFDLPAPPKAAAGRGGQATEVK
jgi:hypothetical protein